VPWEELSKWALATLALLLSWFGVDLYRRVKELEKERVTRKDVDELRTSMMATFAHGHGLLDRAISQQEAARMAQHEENREMLIRMETKMDNNEERAAKTRHETLNEVHALALSVAVLSRKDER
jgi:hypothetical protein